MRHGPGCSPIAFLLGVPRMRRLLLLTAALSLVACFDEAHIEEDGGPIKTLRLSAGEDGNFQYCDAAGECRELPNPYHCDTLVIDINTETGQTCETCVDED